MIYLASPYTHADPAVQEARFTHALQATAELLKQKRWVYSPIVHCHSLALAHKLPGDFSFWKEYNFAMILKADLFMILRIEGYLDSKGVAAEKAYAVSLNKPVEYL